MSEIQIKKVLDTKLKQDYQILVPYLIIKTRIDNIIKDIQKNYKMDGFRKGLVPENILRQKYEASIMTEESEKIINEVSKKIIDENNLKLALTPKIEIKVFESQKDFEYMVFIEILPTVPEIELSKIKTIKRDVVVDKNEVAEFISKLTKQHRKWEEQNEDYKAKKGNAVNIDYVGKIDKEIFEGGSAKNHQLELGSKSFIDNFEDQLIGKKAGNEVRVKVKFPKEYHNSQYANKAAEFEVKINSVSVAIDPELNDEFIKTNFGLENITKLEEIAQSQLNKNLEESAKNLFKKDLFDFLNKKYDFDLPQGLVEEQFKSIWQEVEEELKENPGKFKNDQEKEKSKEENKELAKRMIRSGIILSDLAKKHEISISNDDLIAEINKKANEFPGQEKMIAKYYQDNPSAIQNLRGKILEDKVIDFILNKSNIETKKISVKDFEKLTLEIS
jgi:trigger factor